jgi:hypothetical protein
VDKDLNRGASGRCSFFKENYLQILSGAFILILEKEKYFSDEKRSSVGGCP